MVYVRSMRSPTRSRHVGLVPGSLACAASRRLTLSGAVRIQEHLPPSVPTDAASAQAADPSAPDADSRR